MWQNSELEAESVDRRSSMAGHPSSFSSSSNTVDNRIMLTKIVFVLIFVALAFARLQDVEPSI